MHNFKEEKKEKLKKYQPIEEEAKECPNCHCINEPEAKFCAECGYGFENKKICPYCNAKISANVNICQFCGEWLLEGKCRFCLADIEEDQSFCAECGGMLKSIACPKCSELSDFEFCAKCGYPLTPRAKEAYNKLKIKHEAGEIKLDADSFKKTTLIEKETKNSSMEADELFKMKAYTQKIEKKEEKDFTPLFSHKQRESFKFIDKILEKEIDEQGELAESPMPASQEEHRKDTKGIEEIMKKAISKVQEFKKKEELKQKAQGTVYLNKKKVGILIRNEDGIPDDTYWLWVNGIKVGYVSYKTGGEITFDVSLSEGINTVELRFDRPSGIGTYASINIGGQRLLFGGWRSHTWMVVVSSTEK